jgi:quercetin dioxygenase-like cupin family protein
MNEPYTFIADLNAEVQIPVNGILSRTLYNDDRLKVVLFGFAEGQELSAHTAPMPAVIQIVKGEARLTLGDRTMDAGPGSFAHMPPRLEHALFAKTPVVMLLMMLKQNPNA